MLPPLYFLFSGRARRKQTTRLALTNWDALRMDTSYSAAWQSLIFRVETPQSPLTVSDSLEWRNAARLEALRAVRLLEDRELTKAEVLEALEVRAMADNAEAMLAEAVARAPAGRRVVGQTGTPQASGLATEPPFAPGAGLSNTAPGSSHCGPDSGGFDTLDISCYLRWNSKAFQEFRRAMRFILEELQGGHSGYLSNPADGSAIPVSPSGWQHGPRGAGVSTPWILRPWPGVEIHLADDEDAEATEKVNCFISIGAIAFLSVGGLYWVYEALHLLASLGATCTDTVIARVDGCVYLPGVPVREFVAHVVEGKFITKAEKGSLYFQRREWTGFDLGKGIRLRVYDKLRELEAHSEKWQLMVANRWGGEVPPCASRVEFQVRREQLQEHWGIRTLKDLEDKSPALFVHLSCKWFRMTDREVDAKNRHQSRAKVCALWERVAQAFKSVYDWDGQVLEKPVKLVPNVKRLEDGIVGSLTSAAASLGRTFTTPMEAAVWAAEFVCKRAADIFAGTAEKRILFGALYASAAGNGDACAVDLGEYEWGEDGAKNYVRSEHRAGVLQNF